MTAPSSARSPSSRSGAEVDVEEPKGEPCFPEETDRTYVFIAGGIGITIFRSMLLYIAEEQLPYGVTLLYSNRDRESTAFLDELLDSTARNDERPSRPDDDRRPGLEGRDGGGSIRPSSRDHLDDDLAVSPLPPCRPAADGRGRRRAAGAPASQTTSSGPTLQRLLGPRAEHANPPPRRRVFRSPGWVAPPGAMRNAGVSSLGRRLLSHARVTDGGCA